MTARDAPRVLLVAPPWTWPNAGSLALATLRPVLEGAGIATDTLHGSLHFPKTRSDAGFLEGQSAFLFVPHLYPDVTVDEAIEGALTAYTRAMTLSGLLGPAGATLPGHLGLDEGAMRAALRADIASAGLCLDRCLERIFAARYDVVGFSMTFESHVQGALALARRIKARSPDTKVVFGGAACFEEQGDGLAASFPEIDAVCHTEGEAVIVPLVSALRSGGPLDSVPGIAYLGPGGELRHTPSPPMARDLDHLPLPDYDPFVAELEASAWRQHPPRLFFETSRGCWWGQKHLCTFCGLNAEGLAFRSKSGDRAYAEIAHLYHRYPLAQYLQATDNILEMSYFETVLPRLARELPQKPGRPLRLFYEIKSNLKREQVALLAEAHVDAVQPGIESFSDEVLRLMNKGATGLGQLQFIKWADEVGLRTVYNLLVQNPGETAEAYEELRALLPFIRHLPPPGVITSTNIERFSPYHSRPEAYGIRKLAPRAHYGLLYRGARADIGRLAYQFDCEHDMHTDERLRQTQGAFAREVLGWVNSWRPDQAFYVDYGDHLLVMDARGTRPLTAIVAGVAARVFRYLDRVRPRDAVLRQFAGEREGFVSCLLDTWTHRRWLASDGRDRCLLVLPRRSAERAVQREARPPAASDGAGSDEGGPVPRPDGAVPSDAVGQA